MLNAAEKNNIPVVLNAVGVEGYSAENENCQLLKASLQLPCLKCVTTRDDLQTLTKGYFDENSRTSLGKVADPAVWISEAYDIIKENGANKVGIGIARGELFLDNEKKFSTQQMLDLYVGIIKTLLDNKYQVEIFTNGLTTDNDFAHKTCAKLEEEGINVDCKIPATTRDLVSIISSYRAIVATRLHSCIIAYSLNVPAVGLVWNKKLKLFGRNIKRESNFVDIQNLNPSYIFNQLEIAIEYGYDQTQKEEFRNTIVESISKTRQYIKV